MRRKTLVIGGFVLLLAGPALSQGGWGPWDVATITESEIPSDLIGKSFDGVRVYFPGSNGPRDVETIQILSVRIDGQEAAAMGFPAPDPVRLDRHVNCSATLQAGVTKLAAEAKALGADAVIGIGPPDASTAWPSYLCAVLISRNTRSPDARGSATHGIVLKGTAVKTKAS